MSVVQRAVQALSRATAAAPGTSAPGTAAPSTAAPSTAAPSTQHPHDHKYVAFEDQFRGTDHTVAERVRAYVPIFASAGAHPVVDLGCGRGELLAALTKAGLTARGVDANAEMAAIARAQGLDAMHGDAVAYLDALADDTLGGIVATQVIEHLEPAYLTRLIDSASRTLRPGAPIVLETINPACWLAFFSSYIRDLTHVRPVHPETLQYLLRASGFERVELQYSAPVPDAMKLKTFDLPLALQSSNDPTAVAMQGLAHAVNANAIILNSLMFTHMDYAAIGYRL
jgi:SAM-dependent methyltransferase